MADRITRHGDPIDTMSLAWDDCRSMADPPMASAAPAVTANPAPSAVSGGQNARRGGRRPRQNPDPSARARPRPVRAMVTLTANPSPTRTPAIAARGTTWAAVPSGDRAPDTAGDITATAATPKATAWPSTWAPAT